MMSPVRPLAAAPASKAASSGQPFQTVSIDATYAPIAMKAALPSDSCPTDRIT